MKNLNELRTLTEKGKYTNIWNKVKNIKGVTNQEKDMISNMDPSYLGQVIKALAPMFEEVTEDLSEARMPMYKPTKFDGKEFDKKKEVKNIKNMIKALHKVASMQDDFQYTAETGYTKGGNPNDIYKSLVECEQALYSYMNGVERGQWDGTIDMDRD
jgi:predicted RNA-binding protein with EMAP domain